jgi:hypothetical protein
MELIASFDGPSDARYWLTFAACVMLGLVAGGIFRSAWKAFLIAGAIAAALTYISLASAKGDMADLMASLYSPIFGLAGGCTGGIIGGAFQIRHWLKT